MAQTSASSPPTGAWRPGTRVRVRGEQWRIEGVEHGADCTALRLRPLMGGSRDAITLLAPFDRPALLDDAVRVAVVNRRRCMHEVDRTLADVRCFGGLAQAARASIRVLPYQLEPALAMLRHGISRVLVADDVGLGKTIEAGLVIAELTAAIESARILVLTPAGLREQWRQELASHFALASELADSEWLRRTAAERPAHLNPWSLPGIHVASHDLVKRPEALRALEDVSWDLVVVDEAHAATTGTDRRAAIHRVACSAQRVMLLTATPPAGDPAELAALRAIGRAGIDEPPPAIFARRTQDVRPGVRRRTRVTAVAPAPAEIAMHRALERYSDRLCREAAARDDERARLASIVLRKRALSSAGSLLVSLQRRIALLQGAQAAGPRQLALPLGDEDPLEDGEPIDALAAPGLDDMAKELRWLRAIAETARTAAREESKVAWLLRFLRRVREPVIVFTEYRDTLERLEQRIASTGRSVAVLHGGMDPGSRAAVPWLLRAGAATLLATDAAAEGLNLHHRCRTVIHFELPWNPARLEQRAGRVDRLGQAARVHEIALVTSATAERLVLEPLARRLAHIQRTGFGSSMFPALSESRIAEAVMSGSPLEWLARDDPGEIEIGVAQTDLRDESAAEAVRIETQRTLLNRSPRRPGRSASSGAHTVWVARSPSRSMPTGLTLVFAIDIENAAGRRVHGEHVLITVARDTGRSRRSVDLRSIVAAALTPGMRNAVEERVRSVLDRLTPLARSRHLRMLERRLAISRVCASAARRLVQLPLLGRTADPPARRVIELAPLDDADLVARRSLVAAIVHEPERR